MTGVENGYRGNSSELMLSTREHRHVPQAAPSDIRAGEHVVQFYETDTVLVDAVGDFINTAIREGGAGIVIATRAHREAIDEWLQASGLDIAAAKANGRYVTLDAVEALATFMLDGSPQPERFAEMFGDIITRATAGGRRLHVFGEMVSLLAIDGNHDAAIRLEELWNDLQLVYPFALFCAYPIHSLGGEGLNEFFSHVCAAHSRIIPAESYTALSTPDDQMRAISVLQQKAMSLELEVAERKRAEEQLREALAAERTARRESESALRLRDEFLSIAAHELRTPLTVLTGHAQFLGRKLKRDGQLEPDRIARSLEAVGDQAGALSRLLNQLLDVSRLEGGKLLLERQPTDLTTLVEQVVSGVQAYTERHTITFTAPASLSVQVDPLRMEQVLFNLLDNAIKYSENGESIDVVLSGPVDGAVELAVEDQGIGIPIDKREQIFERFSQAHGNGHKRGLGIGLYVSRQIVELHGGTIRAEFPEDSGARFVVRLPVD